MPDHVQGWTQQEMDTWKAAQAIDAEKAKKAKEGWAPTAEETAWANLPESSQKFREWSPDAFGLQDRRLDPLRKEWRYRKGQLYPSESLARQQEILAAQDLSQIPTAQMGLGMGQAQQMMLAQAARSPADARGAIWGGAASQGEVVGRAAEQRSQLEMERLQQQLAAEAWAGDLAAKLRMGDMATTTARESAFWRNKAGLYSQDVAAQQQVQGAGIGAGGAMAAGFLSAGQKSADEEEKKNTVSDRRLKRGAYRSDDFADSLLGALRSVHA